VAGCPSSAKNAAPKGASNADLLKQAGVFRFSEQMPPEIGANLRRNGRDPLPIARDFLKENR
jgi:hypothetical protein